MVVCKLCGAEISQNNLEEHLWNYHCLNYRDYYEVVNSMPEPEVCWRCNSVKYPLSHIHPELPGIPCWGCITKKTQAENTKKQVLETMRDFQEQVLSNKYYRHLISCPEALSASLTHSLTETAGVMDAIAKNCGITINRRTDIFTFKPENVACPIEISKRNKNSYIVEVSPFSCIKDSDNIYEIIIGSKVYHLQLPEILPYEVMHHQKYSILNNSKAARNMGKRLRIGMTDKVYKFFDSDNPSKVNQKSIFKILEKVKDEDRDKLNYVILSDKTLNEIIREIMNEICPSLVGVYDRIFMKNYIRFTPQHPNNGFEMEFSLNQKETSKDILTILVWN